MSEPLEVRGAALLAQLVGTAPLPPAPARPVELLPLVRAAVQRHTPAGGAPCLLGPDGETWPLDDARTAHIVAGLAVELLGRPIRLSVARALCLLIAAEWTHAGSTTPQ